MSDKAKRKRKTKNAKINDDVEMEDVDDVPVKGRAKAKAKAKATKRRKGADEVDEMIITSGKDEKPAKRGRVEEEKLPLSDLFKKYANEENLIGPDEMMAFFSDLEVDPANDIEALVLTMLWKASQQGYFTMDEFVNGMKSIGANDMKTLSQKLRSQTNQLLLDKKQFATIYQFAFQYCRDNPLSRIIDSETAADMLNVVLKAYFNHSKKANNVTQFVEFVKEQKAQFRTFNLDQWNCVFNFLDSNVVTAEGLKDYDMDASWPTIIDSFVEWVVKKTEA